MRVHLLTSNLDVGGGGSHQNAIAFVRALRALGHTVSVSALFQEGNDPPADIRVVTEIGKNDSFLSVQRLAADAMKRNEGECDVFLVYGQALLWGAGMYRAEGGKKPVAVYLDSHLDSMSESYRQDGLIHRIKHILWEKWRGFPIARRIDLFIVVSPYLKERYVRAGFPKEKFVVVPNAFVFSEYAHEPAHSSGPVHLLSVGRLSYEKGADVLLEACAQLPRDLKWKLRIVGDGPERQHLQRRIAARDFSGEIELVGRKNGDDLAREYASADIFVLPSRVPEPFGRTVVEAMHAGLPVVVPTQGGAAWVAGEAGVTFHNGEPSSLSEAIVALMRDSARREALAQKAPLQAKRFNAEDVGKRLALALQALLA